jgi:four helix bundle protein
MHNYKELEVWKESIKFCSEIYKLVRKLPEDEKFGLISQL